MIVSLITLTVSFLVTYFITPMFINYFVTIGLVNYDVHKRTKQLVSNSGGIPVISGIVMGLFTYIALKTFIYKDATSMIELFSAITSIFIITFSGFLDDLHSKPQKYEGFTYKMGLKQWQKPLFTLPAVIPLMVINAGETAMSLPILGLVNFGLFYPLIIIPLGIVGCANMVNLLGGFNGSETGMGIIYTLSLGLYALYAHQNIAAILLLSTTVSLIAFLNFNFAPAKILSGDSLTYALGGIVAVSAILGNMEKFALFTMGLFVIEWVLKLRSLIELKHFATSLGVLDKKTGLIKSKYDKVYSLTHIAMGKNGSTEKSIAVKLVALQTLVAILPWIIFVKIV